MRSTSGIHPAHLIRTFQSPCPPNFFIDTNLKDRYLYQERYLGEYKTMSANEKFLAIRKGLLELLVLQIIAAKKVYAADILKQLNATEFATQEGTLYPLLSRMRREGLLDYEWKESETGPPRKYYELTAKGREQLSETLEYWNRINETVKTLGQ